MLLMLISFFWNAGLSQDPLPSNIINDVYLDRSVQLTPELLLQAENAYLRMSGKSALTDAECEQLNSAKALIALTWMLPIKSDLYPSILQDAPELCPIENVAVQLIIANAYHQNSQYEAALDAYWKVINNPTDSWLGITAHFNLVSTHNEQGNIDSAIVNAEHLLIKAENFQAFREKGMYQHLQVNLAGLYNSNFQPQKALQILSNTDTTGFTPYWKTIRSINLLLANKQLNRQSTTNEIWNNHLRDIPLSELPKRSLNEILSQALISRDFVYFQRLRTNRSSEIDPSLIPEDSPYFDLFSDELSNEQFRELWNQYVEHEERFIRLAQSKEAATNKNFTDLDSLLSELEKSKAKNSSWEYFFILLLSTAAISLIIKIVIMRIQKSRLSSQLEAALAGEDGKLQHTASPLSPNDIRILGDAITYGKRVSDALLVLKKINSNVTDVDASGQLIDWTLVDPSGVLKKSEKEILEYIVKDFDAKEISRVLNCSVSHIYNVRSRLRQALDIPNGEQIKEWVSLRSA